MSEPSAGKDQVFKEKQPEIADFTFGEKVASVFDDMLDRSVPQYAEIQRMIVEMAKDFAVPGTHLYDLGCSTGTTLVNLHQQLDPGIRFIGIDNSEEMLKRCRKKLDEHGVNRPCDLVCGDLNSGITIENASVVTMILTLQFIRPLYREKLIRSIVDGMNKDGCLILVEKVLGEDSLFNRLFIKYYYDMKRRHNYSEMEISQKREALENVLIPYKLLENRELLLSCGFRYCDVFIKWYNFTGLIAAK
jgi:tRNA (cmo5U34)-methyltransferase